MEEEVKRSEKQCHAIEAANQGKLLFVLLVTGVDVLVNHTSHPLASS